MASRIWAARQKHVFVQDGSASVDHGGGIITMVAKINQQRFRTAEVLPMLDVQIGPAVNVQLGGKLHLRQTQVVAGAQKAVAQKGAQFAVTGIIFGNVHKIEAPTFVKNIVNFIESAVAGRGGMYHIFPKRPVYEVFST